MQVQVTIPEWLKLGPETRQRLVREFEIPRSQGSMIEGNTVVSDGYTHKDLESITVEKMQVFLDDPENKDFISLFNKVVERIEEEKELVIPVEQMTREQLLLEEWTMGIGRFYSQAIFFNLVPQLLEVISKITGITTQKAEVHEAEKPSLEVTGFSPKKRGRPAKTISGGISGDNTPTAVSEGSNLADPVAPVEEHPGREEHL